MRTGRTLMAGLCAAAALVAWGTPEEDRLAAKGFDLFGKRCSGCHSADSNKEGPRLRGVFGRRAAGLPEFGYSEALRRLPVTWDEDSLDRWLADPESVAPGNDMPLRVTSAEERRAIIAWLRNLPAKP